MGSAADLTALYMIGRAAIIVRPANDAVKQWVWNTVNCVASTPLTLPSNPVNNLHAATKQYVDARAPLETDAQFNTGYGDNTLMTLTTGNNNAAVGSNAANSLTTGLYNMAIGSEALRFNQTGQRNVAIGYGALRAASGSTNVAIGYATGWSITTGIDNIGIGNLALYVPRVGGATTTASGQVAIGSQTGAYTAGTGSYGVGIGNGAVYHTQATAIGAVSEARGVNSTALGFGAIATLDQQIMLGRASEFVTIPQKVQLVHQASAPGVLTDGDMWTTAAGLFVRINGVTKQVTLT